VKRNAVGIDTCDACRFWHNPEGHPMGLCIKEPPTPICVAMQQMPAPAIVDPKKAIQPMAMPIVMGFHPPREPKQGCGAFERDMTFNKQITD
jgi:hypothetical protein